MNEGGAGTQQQLLGNFNALFWDGPSPLSTGFYRGGNTPLMFSSYKEVSPLPYPLPNGKQGFPPILLPPPTESSHMDYQQ